jgi:hypothetical protein
MSWADSILIQPVQDPDGFWERVARDPATVVLVEMLKGEKTERVEVFSSLEKAKDFIDDEGIVNAVVYTARIDDPDWGDERPH